MKVVKKAKPEPVFEYTTANRALSTMELATSWVDEHGMISPEEGTDRVFRAAAIGGDFAVNVRIGPGRVQTNRYRHYAVAMRIAIALMLEGRLPMLYAAISNRDAFIGGRAYRDEKTGRWVSRFEATADAYQHYLDMWNEMSGERLRCPALQALRNVGVARPTRRIRYKVKGDRDKRRGSINHMPER